jgi:hypothetical protein
MPHALSSPSRHSLRFLIALVTAVSTLTACGGGESARSDTTRPAESSPASASAGTHAHTAPHGGILVELGDEVAHLEFVVDTVRAEILAYVLDGEAEKGIALTQGRLDLKMLDLVPGGEVFTVFGGKGSALTGERPDSTSTFIAFVPQLKEHPAFHGVLQRVEVRGQVFTDIPITYPPEPRP